MPEMTDERLYLESVIEDVIARLRVDVKTVEDMNDNGGFYDRYKISLMFNGRILSEEWTN